MDSGFVILAGALEFATVRPLSIFRTTVRTTVQRLPDQERLEREIREPYRIITNWYRT